MVHPNTQAVDYVWERFIDAATNDATQALMKSIGEIVTAATHRPRFPETDAHRKFKETFAQKTRALSQQHPYLQLTEELEYFEGN